MSLSFFCSGSSALAIAILTLSTCGDTSSTENVGGSGSDDEQSTDTDTEREVIGPVTLTPPAPVLKQDAAEELGSLCSTFSPCDCAGYDYVTVEACEGEFDTHGGCIDRDLQAETPR